MFSRFARTVWRAITDRDAYVDDFAKRRIGSGLAYLYFLAVATMFVGLLPVAAVWMSAAPGTRDAAANFALLVDAEYPDDLVLTLSGGVLGTNRDEPIVFDFSDRWPNGEGPAPVIVIDTSAAVEDIETYGALALLTDESIVVRDDDQLRVFLYREWEEDHVIDKESVDDFVETLSSFAPYLPWIVGAGILVLLLALPWILGGVYWLAELLFLLVATFILWLASFATGRSFTYGKLYTLGLFGVTGPFLLGLFDGFLGLGELRLPIIVFFVWMSAVMMRFPRSLPLMPPPPPAFAKASADRPGSAIPTKKAAASKKKAPPKKA